jgi:hypothetical protein
VVQRERDAVVRGIAYKGTVEIATRLSDRPALRR